MRGKRATKRPIKPDPKHKSELLGKLINNIMERGKKTTAQTIVYDMLDIVKEKTKQDPVNVLNLAFKNVGPDVEVKSKRVGGGNFQVPVEVNADRKLTLTIRWIVGACKAKKGKPMAVKLADEIMAASKGEGDAMKKRLDVYRMAEANKAFAHFTR